MAFDKNILLYMYKFMYICLPNEKLSIDYSKTTYLKRITNSNFAYVKIYILGHLE